MAEWREGGRCVPCSYRMSWLVLDGKSAAERKQCPWRQGRDRTSSPLALKRGGSRSWRCEDLLPTKGEEHAQQHASTGLTGFATGPECDYFCATTNTPPQSKSSMA
jgi:hypothetical protein